MPARPVSTVRAEGLMQWTDLDHIDVLLPLAGVEAALKPIYDVHVDGSRIGCVSKAAGTALMPTVFMATTRDQLRSYVAPDLEGCIRWLVEEAGMVTGPPDQEPGTRLDA